MLLLYVILSQEIADGVNKSARAVQAAEAGIRQIGSRAHQQTMCMLSLSYIPYIMADHVTSS